MAGNVSRIVIDTNLWISFLISNKYNKLDQLIKNHKTRLLFSQQLLDEFLEVISRPKFKKVFSESAIVDILMDIENVADFVQVNSSVDLCRDKKDNFLLALCLDGKADYLLTGDKDLLTIQQFNNTFILSLSDYLKRMRF